MQNNVSPFIQIKEFGRIKIVGYRVLCPGEVPQLCILANKA